MHSSSGRHITIIGGAALDILAQSDSLSTDSGSSHIGKIKLQEGGSARNVAECVARLGFDRDLTFIAAVGTDDKADFIKKSLRAVNIVSINLSFTQGHQWSLRQPRREICFLQWTNQRAGRIPCGHR